MHDQDQRIDRLTRTNRRLKAACAALGACLLLGAGLAAQRGPDDAIPFESTTIPHEAVGVHDSTGFAVFVRADGNLVIIKSDGRVIQTKNQPMAVRF